MITEPVHSQLVRYRRLVQALALLARSSHSVDAVVQAVHQQTGALFPAQVTLLALLQPGGDWLWEVFEGDMRYTQRLPYYPEGVIEGVLRGEALSIPDIFAYLETHPVRARRLLDVGEVILDVGALEEQPDQAAQAMLFVPLEAEGERTGVLSIQSYQAGAFDETDLEFLHLLGQHVSIALGNAALREQLEYLTHTDELTGLPNRRAFYQLVLQALGTARQEGRELGLIMLDVHEFKRVNDDFGHHVGDAVLRTLGQVLTTMFPEPDTAFRLGGDEFALLVWEPETRLEELSVRLTQALRAADWPPGSGPISLQAGWALPPAGVGIDEWLSLADARMYRVKKRRTASVPVNWGLDFEGNLN